MKEIKEEVKRIKAIGLVWGAFGTGENCTGIIEEIIKPETGGIFTKYMGCNYLFKGYPDVRIIDAISVPKKMVSRLLALISEKSVKFFLGAIFLFYWILPKSIKRPIIISFWNYFLAIAEAALIKVMLPENRYCQSVNEMRRASEVLFKRIKCEEMLLRARKTREIIFMLLEDYAYKARLKDILPHLNKELLKENPRKEISRVFDILISRDISCLAKWKEFRKILLNALRIRVLRDYIVDFLMEIDLEKIKMDEADWYYVLDRNDYRYGGLTHEERMKISAELDKKVGNHRPKVIFKEKQ